MPFEIPGYDDWKLASPPRFEDGPGDDDDDDTDDFDGDIGGEG